MKLWKVSGTRVLTFIHFLVDKLGSFARKSCCCCNRKLKRLHSSEVEGLFVFDTTKCLSARHFQNAAKSPEINTK